METVPTISAKNTAATRCFFISALDWIAEKIGVDWVHAFENVRHYSSVFGGGIRRPVNAVNSASN
jgi:hypothetical protein